jgi:hypothetical protein
VPPHPLDGPRNRLIGLKASVRGDRLHRPLQQTHGCQVSLQVSAFSPSARDLCLSMQGTGISDAQLARAGLPLRGRAGRAIARRGIIADLVRAWFQGAREVEPRWLSFSRDRNHYAGKSRYYGANYSYCNVCNVVDELLAAQLIVEERTRPGQRGWRSRMRATPDLIDRLAPFGKLDFAPGEPIRLKNAEGDLIDYPESSLTRTMRREVDALNAAWQSVCIALPTDAPAAAPRPVPARTSGYRVFNGRWHQGGRFYGPFWQSLPKAQRAQLTIDGCAVAEHDFAQLHPRLLYAEFGLEPDGDAYSISGYEHERALVKCAWQILINASSKRAAVMAIAWELGGSQHQAQAVQLLAALAQHHARIEQAFCSGRGLRLQYLDSQLMFAIQRRCMSEGLVALPIHDSFIVRANHASRIQQIMHDQLQQLTRQLVHQSLN